MTAEEITEIIMKRVLALVLVFLMCFIMTNCSRDSKEDGKDTHYKVEDIEIGTALGEFTSTDMEGNEVTSDIFGDKDVTIVNVWASYYFPCILEMPLLADLSKRLPDSAQIVGRVFDATGEDQEAIK